MNRFSFKHIARLLIELVVLLAIYFLGTQLAVWLAWPIPGGVVGLGLLLATFATGLVKPAALQLGAGVLMASAQASRRMLQRQTISTVNAFTSITDSVLKPITSRMRQPSLRTRPP